MYVSATFGTPNDATFNAGLIKKTCVYTQLEVGGSIHTLHKVRKAKTIVNNFPPYQLASPIFFSASFLFVNHLASGRSQLAKVALVVAQSVTPCAKLTTG